MTDVGLRSAEQQLDALIERRAKEAEAANRVAEAWRESEQRYAARRQADVRAEWAAFYRQQIEAAEQMRERAEERLRRLIDA